MSEATPEVLHKRIAAQQEHRINLSVDQEQRDGLIRSVRAQVPGISHEDAEDAVQDAWIVLAEKANRLDPGPVGGYLRGTARYKAMHIRDKSRRTTSLEALTEVTGDSAQLLADLRFDSLSSHLELSELADADESEGSR
jgi:DNA-directed RNA polymerase specialized sigma24 family protein